MDIEHIRQAQKEFFEKGLSRDVNFRIEHLRKFKSVLKENEADLYKAIHADFRKSEMETYLTELSILYHELNLAIRKVKTWSRKKQVPTNLANRPGRSYILPEPLGNTLVIGTWNYPYQLSLLPAISSLAAGNTVIIKPSELSSRTSAVMARLLNHHFPTGLLHVVEGGADISGSLLELPFDKIFFTGSKRVGQIVYEKAARHLTPVVLELGGKSPTFVLADADIKISARRIIWAKFLNAGQTCVAPDYILVERSIENDLLEALAAEMKRYEDFKDDFPDHYLQIIDTSHFDRLKGFIEEGKIYAGGKMNREKRYFGPTLLRNVHFGDPIMKEEIFGPILPVLGFDSLPRAIERVKSLPKPLSCYVYGRDRKKIKKIIREISFGGGAINDSVVHLANSNLPFGGVGGSGFGSYHGYAGFMTFSHFKSLLRKPFKPDIPVRYPPYTEWKKKIMRWILE